jgi:predicted transcriptional regulator
MPASPVVAFRFDPELLERIDERADAEHRTRRNMVERMALTYFEREDGEPIESKAAA